MTDVVQRLGNSVGYSRPRLDLLLIRDPREDGGRSEPRLQPGPSLQERRVDAAELEVVHHLAQQA